MSGIPYLEWDELLQLRLVSRAGKALTTLIMKAYGKYMNEQEKWTREGVSIIHTDPETGDVQMSSTIAPAYG